MSERGADELALGYDPKPDGYDLSKDPRCLFGWGPPTCHHMFGHACFRALGHPGRCGDVEIHDHLPCERKQRPKRWDDELRAEANR